ncbi:putative late blight resistance protein R1C-3 isoform X1 [Salvia divinorum]|uniref:Late blight resistance protein R1C-3 isoform X1 n=1 Tax=Salvia divinorum TaxID=28513 RepID=A0ABD1GEJ3_SALDI
MHIIKYQRHGGDPIPNLIREVEDPEGDFEGEGDDEDTNEEREEENDGKCTSDHEDIKEEDYDEEIANRGEDDEGEDEDTNVEDEQRTMGSTRTIMRIPKRMMKARAQIRIQMTRMRKRMMTNIPMISRKWSKRHRQVACEGVLKKMVEAYANVEEHESFSRL